MSRSLVGLQALRFVAAALVVAHHATKYTAERLTISDIWRNGERGVDIFFVISGFVMIWSSTRPGLADDWRAFALKRVDRIVPLYWLATTLKLITMILAGSFVLHAALDVDLIWKSYFFIPTQKTGGPIEPLLGVGWTLIYEMFFYSIFTIALATRRNVYLVVGVALLACSIASLFKPHPIPAWAFFFDTIVIEFYLGMLLAGALIRFPSMNRYLALSLCTIGLAYTLMSSNYLNLARFIDYGFPAALIVMGVVYLEPMLHRRMPKFLVFLGSASYAIYLFHPMTSPLGAVLLYKAGLHAVWLSVILCTVIGIVAGCFVYRFVEPRLHFLARWSRRYHNPVINVSTTPTGDEHETQVLTLPAREP